MSYEPSSYVMSDRPDKPLVVKCDYNTRRQKLSFTSARFCSYERLKEKVLLSLVVPFILKTLIPLDREKLCALGASIHDTMEGSRRRAELHPGRSNIGRSDRILPFRR
jgi:hypothetical protein